MLRKDKLNKLEVLISKALIDSYISHDEFVSVKYCVKWILWNERRNKKSWKFCGIYYIKTMETYCISCKRLID